MACPLILMLVSGSVGSSGSRMASHSPSVWASTPPITPSHASSAALWSCSFNRVVTDTSPSVVAGSMTRHEIVLWAVHRDHRPRRIRPNAASLRSHSSSGARASSLVRASPVSLFFSSSRQAWILFRAGDVEAAAQAAAKSVAALHYYLHAWTAQLSHYKHAF